MRLKSGTVLGASIVGAILVILLGYSGIYKYIVKTTYLHQWNDNYDCRLTLLPSAFVSNIYIEGNGLTMKQNVLLAFITAASLILFSTLGNYVNKFKRDFPNFFSNNPFSYWNIFCILDGWFYTQGIKDASFLNAKTIILRL